MNLSDYTVNIRLPDDILQKCRDESLNPSDYVIYMPKRGDYYYLAAPDKIMNKPGPQRVKHVSPNLKNQLENFVGLKSERVAYLKCAPNFVITPHKDSGVSFRHYCLTWAIMPDPPGEVAPTDFFDDSGNHIASQHYDNNAFILNTLVTHAMKNNQHTRILLQMMFGMDAAELKAKIDDHVSSR